MFLGAWGEILGRYRRVFAAAWSERHRHRTGDRRREEAAFLPAVLEVQETPPHPLAHLGLWLILLFFAGALLWAWLGRVDIVVAAAGRIIPDERTKVVQAAEDGEIRAIYVEDGRRVSAGEVLIELDPTASEAEYIKAREAWLAARLEEAGARLLAASADGKAASTPLLIAVADLEDIDAETREEHQRLLDGAYHEQRERLAQIVRELAVARGEREVLLRQIEKQEAVLPMIAEKVAAIGKLAAGGHYPRRQFEDLRREQVEGEQDLRYLRSRAAKAEAEIARVEQSRTTTAASFRREMLDRAGEARRRAAGLRQDLVKIERMRQSRRITAPIAGVAQQLAVHTIGGIVKSGQSLLALAPEDDKLEVEALVENKDIGFVRAGQKAEIKIDAFPFTKYGLIDGEVVSLSGDAVEDEQLGLVYQARVRLARATMEVEGRDVRLRPGMKVIVEIKTGERRVIEFFFAPLLQVAHESLGER